MAEFNSKLIGSFLGSVRKYMQVRGPMSQKELAELTEVGVSTMSRFLNQKTLDINSQLIAKIVAKLNIPLHEIIDFVDESYTDKFIRLVKFYKDDSHDAAEGVGEEKPERTEVREETFHKENQSEAKDEFLDSFTSLGTSERAATARVSAGGGGKKVSIPFQPDGSAKNSQSSIKEKLESLSPRQKAYMTDFLSLDMECRDLIVDLGNNLFRYFKQKGIVF